MYDLDIIVKKGRTYKYNTSHIIFNSFNSNIENEYIGMLRILLQHVEEQHII